MTKRYIKRYILSLRKRETKKSIKKIYLCTYLWIKKFPCESATLVNWVNQSFQIIRTRTFVSIGTATSILRASQIFFFFFFLAILAIPIGSVFVVMVSIHGKVLVGFRLEFLQLGHVTLDNDSRCDLRGHTFRGRVTSDPGSILSTPGTLFRVFLRHSDHFVGTPLERISTTTSAFIYDVRFALPISTISRTWQW